MKQGIFTFFDNMIFGSPLLRFTVTPALFVIIAFLLHALFLNSIGAEILERIVAIVNDDVILLSEYKKELESAKKSGRRRSVEEVLEEMINSNLLLHEAKKYWAGVSVVRNDTAIDDKAVINEYINRRIKAFIHIAYEDIEAYYMNNRDLFGNREFYNARDEIEEYLVNEELKVRLRQYLKELRKSAYIRVQLND